MAHTMAIIATAESGVPGRYGNQYARNPSGASGLWQILGQEVPGDIFNALINAKNAVWKLRHQGLGAWAASRHAWAPLLGPGFDVREDIDSILPNPLDLLKLLPNPKDMLPDWLQGLGGWLIGKAGDYIKGALKGVLGGSVPGWGVLDGLAQQLGLQITSTYRLGDDGYHGQLMGPGGRAHATDYAGAAGAMLRFAREVGTRHGEQLKELIHTPLGWGVKNGQRVGLDFPFPWGNHYDHVHVAFRKGGIFGAPYVGSYAGGGTLPADGFYYGHRGETVSPGGGPLVHIEHADMRTVTSAHVFANKLAFRLS